MDEGICHCLLGRNLLEGTLNNLNRASLGKDTWDPLSFFLYAWSYKIGKERERVLVEDGTIESHTHAYSVCKGMHVSDMHISCPLFAHH